jgi:Holliday junction DNA helicase RuvA
MIGKISGLLIESSFTEIMIDVNGVAYLLNIPMSTFDALPREGKKVSVFTYLHVREDALELYGFAEKFEKQLFLLLLSVSGIGPKVALNILSSMTVNSFCNAIANADIKALNRLKGIGKKSAERLVLELKNKVATISPESQLNKTEHDESHSHEIENAVLALEQLGLKFEYATDAVRNIAANLDKKECTTENLIKLTLAQSNK